MKSTILALLTGIALFGFGASSAKAVAIVIDNGDFGSGYAVSGVTEQIVTPPATVTYGNDHAFNTAANDNAANATYSFSGLASGTYDVFASWRQGGQNNTGLMQLTISDGGPTVSVNQFFNPAGGGTPGNGGPLADLVLNDGTQNIDFQRLGQVTVTDGGLVVTASRDPASPQPFFINDAIAINLIPEPSAAVLGLLGLAAFGFRRRRRTCGSG